MKRFTESSISIKILTALIGAILFGLLLSQASTLYAFQVSPLPEGNLITNPWFRAFSDPNDSALDGWTDAAGQNAYWSSSQKESNPSPDIVYSSICGNEPVYCGTSARMSFRNGQSGGIAQPNVDAYLYQIVAADASKTRLKFFMHWVSHIVDEADVVIYGATSPQGPWTAVWAPFYHSQSELEMPPEGGTIEDIWNQTGMLETVVTQGYPYYKVQFHVRLPDDISTGFKMTGVYFTVEDAIDGDVPTPTQTVESTPDATITAEPTVEPSPQDQLLLTATGVSETQIQVNWTDYASDGSKYTVQRSPDGVTGWSEVSRLRSNVSSYTDTGLDFGTTYFYRVQTTGTSTTRTSNVDPATTKGGTSPTLVPTPTATITVEPTAGPTDEPTAEPTSTATATKPAPTPTSTALAPTATSTSTAPASTATPTNPAPTPTSTPEPTTTPDSGDGLVLSATAISPTAVMLSWLDTVDDGSNYILERSLNGVSGWTQVSRLRAGNTAYADAGLQSGTQYFYRVYTIGTGNTRTSNVVSMTTQ